MFLYVYLLSSVILVFLIGLFLETKYKPFLTVSMLITLLTPTPALINSYMYEPALFTFFFDLLLENKYSFSFTNSGNEPLKISNAKGSCGCTVPNWPKEPILPGESGKIDVVFRPSKGQAGSKQTKTVTVSANTTPENTILKITAFVNKAEE